MKNILLWFCLLFIGFNCAAQKENYPVYSAAAPPFGLYQSKDDYLNLRVTNPNVLFSPIASMSSDGINNFCRKKEHGEKGDRASPKDYFAASTGKTFYISYNGEWYKA